jgi:hypothetical protein
MRDLKALQASLADNHREVRNLQVLQMRPGRSPAELDLLRNLERSARASVKLAQKALAHRRKLEAGK